MKILQEILERLNMEVDIEYFDLSITERERVVNVLWDEVYGPSYERSLEDTRMDNPLFQQIQILHFLFDILKEFEHEEQFEICDVVSRLINITESKIQQIDRYYAHTNEKTNRNT